MVVQAQFGATSGPVSPPLPIVLAAPALTAASFDGQALSLTLGALPAGSAAPTAFALVLSRNGVAVQSESVAPAPGSAPLVFAVNQPIDAAASYTVEWSVCAGPSTGPAGSATVVLGTPAVSSIDFDPVTGNCTVGWAAVANAASYSVLVENGGQTFLASTVQAPLHQAVYTPSQLLQGAITHLKSAPEAASRR